MSLYRTYVLMGDGHVHKPPVISEYETDAQAALSAFCLRSNGTGVEVWHGARLIFRLNGEVVAAGSPGSR